MSRFQFACIEIVTPLKIESAATAIHRLNKIRTDSKETRISISMAIFTKQVDVVPRYVPISCAEQTCLLIVSVESKLIHYPTLKTTTYFVAGRTDACKRVDSSDRDEPSFGSRSATSSIRFVRQNVERESARREQTKDGNISAA